MAKLPVARKKSMFAEAVEGKPSANSVQPELCHGSGELNLSSAMVGQNVAGEKDTKCLIDTEEKSNPRKIGDPVSVRHRKVSVNAFRSGLSLQRMTIADYARLTGTPENTVKSWSSGRTEAPGAAQAVLEMLDLEPGLAERLRSAGWEPLR
jgi:DNA-binding transcriptional regulator YiaG